MQKKFLKLSLLLIIGIVIFIFSNRYYYTNSKTISIANNLTNIERISLIKNIIDNSNDEDLNINTNDVKAESIYTININNNNLVVFHDTTFDSHLVNFMVFEEKNNNLNLKLYEANVLKFNILNPSFFLLETKEIGRGTGYRSSEYLLYDFNFNLVWINEKSLVQASTNGNEIFKQFNSIELIDNQIHCKSSEIYLINDDPIKFEEFTTKFKYENNKFKEVIENEF